MGRLILETPRLLLREFDERDAATFYVLGSDPAITPGRHKKIALVPNKAEVIELVKSLDNV